MPNPANSFVDQFYGKKALWKTDLSQGIVVRAENEDDYFIVMGCSRVNEGFKYTQIILALGGCLQFKIIFARGRRFQCALLLNVLVW